MIYLVLPVIYLLILNVIATIRLSKSELYEKTQKVFQTILICGLPLLGAVIVSILLKQDEPIESKKKSILKSILYFVFIMKAETNQKKEYQGYGERNSANDDTMYTGGSV